MAGVKPVMANNAYAGAGLGFNNSNVAVDVTESVGDETGTAQGSQNNNGVLGEVFVGYHIPISDMFFTELEAFTTFHSLSAKDLNVGNVQITRIGIQDSAGGSVGLGLDLSPTTQIFGRVGGVAGWLSVTYRDGNSLHRSLAGLLLGAGVETSINDGRWALRGEFDHVNYQSYTGSLAGGGTKKYNPRTNQVIVSAVYRLGC